MDSKIAVCLPEEELTADELERPAKSRLWKRIREVFVLDVRSLALFRVGLALTVLGDVFFRLVSTPAFLADTGIMPRTVALASEINAWHWSLYLFGGAWWYQVLLLVITALAAVAMLFGYRTRLATFVVWVLMVSVHNRAPILLQGGDQLIRLLLFWAMFVPIGARYSLDAAWGVTTKKTRALSWGTAALLLQIALVYVFAVVAKSKTIWVIEGSAVEYAMHMDQFATVAGTWLLQYPLIMKWLSRATFFIQAISPILLLIPFWTGSIRLVVFFLLFSMHVGMALFLELGPFPFVVWSGLFILLPGIFWDRLAARLKRPLGSGVTIFYDQDCGFCLRMVQGIREFLLLPQAVIAPSQGNEQARQLLQQHNSWVVSTPKPPRHHGGQAYQGESCIEFEAFVELVRQSPAFFWLAPILGFFPHVGRKMYRVVADSRGGAFGRWLQRLRPSKAAWRLSTMMSVVVAISLITAIWWNFLIIDGEKYKMPRVLTWWGHVVRLDQSWDMFKGAFVWDGWYVFHGRLANNEEVDVFYGGSLKFTEGRPVSYEKPADISEMYRYERWRKFLMVLWQGVGEPYQAEFTSWVCREWNKRHEGEERLIQFDLVYMQELTRLRTSQSVEQTVIRRQEC